MNFFFILLMIGIIVLVYNRFSQLVNEQATIHCIQHKWKIDPNTREMYCENCKDRPE